MKHQGLSIPQTLADICHPQHTVLLVYDLQVGIYSQIKQREQVKAHVLTILQAARRIGLRIIFTRHLSLPTSWMGVSQMRMAMAWQKVDAPQEVKPWFLRDSPGWSLLPELSPQVDEAILDKITMSAFEGSWLATALRDCGIQSVLIVGAATEVGIEPTARHAADLGFIPVLIADACGVGNEEAAERSLANLAFAGDTVLTDTKTICALYSV